MKVCIVAHNAYRLMSGDNVGHIGGVERQSSMMARWFANAGHETSLITWVEGQSSDAETIHGVRVIKTCREDAGVRFFRFFYPRWVSLNRALKLANADIYYQNGAEYVTGQVAHWCRRHGRKFVFSAASDLDCEAKLPLLRSMREQRLYRYGLKHADTIIVQTDDQEANLESAFGYPSTVLPMPCDLEPTSHERSTECREPIYQAVLIGRLSPEKNIEMFIDVATGLPEYEFAIVGPDGAEDDYVSGLRSKASKLQNIEFLGPKSREEVGQLLKRASILCCTSHFEGFPNTFLEAWSRGVPVLSTIDPGGVLVKEGVGLHITSVSEMVSGIRTLVGSKDQLETMGNTAERYYENTHYLEAAIQKFSDVFEATLSS